MAAFDWINRLFQGGEQTRGLSGAEASAVALDDANSFYNFRLRRHYTDDDMTGRPDRLWFTDDDVTSRTGLGPHVAEALAEGQRFTDVLVVLSRDDWERGRTRGNSWKEDIIGTLGSAFDELRGRYGLPPTNRPLGVWLVSEGAPEIGGMDLGLVEGEFVTGIMPNLYRTPGPTSRPLLAVHANLPGAWEGYREIGRLYDDQVLFTLGNHWLDNFAHPDLADAAVYRLQRDENGTFFHIVNPDLQDRYQMTSTDQDGTSVITLATRDGRPLAYLVLAVLEEYEPMAEVESKTHDVPGGTPEIAPPMMLEDVPVNVDSPRAMGSKTIIPDAQRERIFTLQERGALLQKVHFSAFMLGYDVFVGKRGELGTAVANPVATFQVRKRTVSIVANGDGVRVDGESLPAGDSRLIEGDAVIEVASQRLEYVELRGVDVEGWPYVGEIRRPASSTYMLWGKDYPIGRSRECRVVLPDEPQNDNIVWKPKVGDGATIRSKTGEIPKSRFYTDSIMVASEHGAIELMDDKAQLVCRARHCYSFIRRDGGVLQLYPTTSGKLPQRLQLEPGDEILIGNCVFHASFTPAGDAVAPAAAPAPRISSDSLMESISTPDFDELDAPMPSSFLNREPEGAGGPLEPVAEVMLEDEATLLEEVEPEPELGLDDLEEVPETFQVFADTRPDPVSDTQRDTERDPIEDLPPDEDVQIIPIVMPRPARPVAAAEDVPEPSTTVRVVEVDDSAAQFELGRPARFVLMGWAVNGTVTAGNHVNADLVIPENRISEEQVFEPRTYFRLKIRGRKGQLEPLDSHDLRVSGRAPTETNYTEVSDLHVAVVRRDDTGDEDFTVELEIVEDRRLPDPRARLVRIDTDEPLAEALFTAGIPLRASHVVELGGMAMVAEFDGSKVVLSRYLEAYQTPDGFRPFFVQHGSARFKTAPEDGSDIVLTDGDRVVAESSVYRFTVA